MSLSGIGSIPAAAGVPSASGIGASTSGGGVLPFGIGATAAGAYVAQGAGAPGEDGSRSLVKKLLAGAVVGAGVGFAATFINPLMALFTSTTPVGWGIKAAAAGIGAAVGAGGVLATHFIGKRRQNLAMQAQSQAAQQQAMPPTPMPQGVTLRANARGPAARKLQEDLTALGLYSGPATRMFDSATAAAVRKYEVMKGVMPTGQATPELRAAVGQDVQLLRQYA
jgi:hypothetical protein